MEKQVFTLQKPKDFEFILEIDGVQHEFVIEKEEYYKVAEIMAPDLKNEELINEAVNEFARIIKAQVPFDFDLDGGTLVKIIDASREHYTIPSNVTF